MASPGIAPISVELEGFTGSGRVATPALLSAMLRAAEKISVQTEIVLLAHHMGFKVIERPLSIEEKRGTQVSIVKRFPKVLNIIRELKKSLNRFPEKGLENKLR